LPSLRRFEPKRFDSNLFDSKRRFDEPKRCEPKRFDSNFFDSKRRFDPYTGRTNLNANFFKQINIE